jgi:hypothetical protein
MGARSALAFALYHPAAALRSTEVERQSYADVAQIPRALIESRERREGPTTGSAPGVAGDAATAGAAGAAVVASAAPDAIPDVASDAATLF